MYLNITFPAFSVLDINQYSYMQSLQVHPT